MNRTHFIYRLFLDKNFNFLSFSVILPVLGIIIGFVTVGLTLAIMEGMESQIYNKLKKISFPSKISGIDNINNETLNNYLEKNNIQYLNGYEEDVLLMKNSFSMVKLHGVEDIFNNNEKMFGENISSFDIETNLPIIYIGQSISRYLNLVQGDTAKIIIPNQLNILTGLPKSKKVVIGGTYKLKLLDYDRRHIFVDYSSLRSVLGNNNMLYYLTDIPNKELENFIDSIANNYKIHYWYTDYKSFISAMDLEKLLYSLIGFIIIGVACFSLINTMSLFVMKKIKHIAILRVLGATNQYIRNIFYLQTIIIWLFSSIASITIIYMIIQIDNSYNIFNYFFPSNIFIDFNLLLPFKYIIYILINSLILVLASGLYPAYKATQLNIIDALRK